MPRTTRNADVGEIVSVYRSERDAGRRYVLLSNEERRA